MFRPNVQRLSFDQAAQWRRSMCDARELAADGVFDAAGLLRSWGRCAWHRASPRCVGKRRRERHARRWVAFVASLPPEVTR